MKRTELEVLAIKEHWARVRDIGCIVSFRPGPTIHHIHGGSVLRELGYDWHPGMGQRQNHYLVIPLWMELHTCLGANGIDGGSLTVEDWEERYGTQMDHLRMVSEILGYDVFRLAGVK